MERQAHLTYSEFMQQYVSLPLVSRHNPKHGLLAAEIMPSLPDGVKV